MAPKGINFSNLIIISPDTGLQRNTTKPTYPKPAEQNAYRWRPESNYPKPDKDYVYTPDQLRLIDKQYMERNTPKMLPFGAVRQIRDLCLNRRNKIIILIIILFL